MSGVADEHNPATVPFLLIHPLDGRAVDLLVAIQGGEKLLNGFGKPFKEPPQAPQPSPHVIVEMRRSNMAESVSVAVAHRAETKEAFVSKEEPQVG